MNGDSSYITGVLYGTSHSSHYSKEKKVEGVRYGDRGGHGAGPPLCQSIDLDIWHPGSPAHLCESAMELSYHVQIIVR